MDNSTVKEYVVEAFMRAHDADDVIRPTQKELKNEIGLAIEHLNNALDILEIKE